MQLLTENLFQQVLIEPVKQCRANKMLAVSGYATSSMVHKHTDYLRQVDGQSSITVIAGMVPRQGIDKAHHKQFVKLSQEGIFGSKFSCKYVVSDNPVHAKVFIWMRNEKPVVAFAGSANYTITGFSENQNEAVTRVNPGEALDFYNKTIERTVDCLDQKIETKVSIKIPRRKTEKKLHRENKDIDADFVTLSLLNSQTGNTPTRSGLNWGKRPGRNPNQAYIAVPSPIRKRNFFPKKSEPFTVLTDDGESFIFVVAQDGDKALHTTQDNSILGKYFRNRLKIKSGEFVKKEHLLSYGRTDVTFLKIDDETYYMDFRASFEK